MTLSPPGQLASNVRALFHSSTRKAASPGCLLEQVATHMLAGLSTAVEAGAKSLLGPFQPTAALQRAAAAAESNAQQGQAGAAQQAGGSRPGSQPGSPTPRSGGPRSALQQAALLALGDSLGRVLGAVSTVGSIVAAVKSQYERVVLPHVVGSAGEARVCSAGLAALVKAADERVLAALQRTLTLLFNQVQECGMGACFEGFGPSK